MHELRLPPRSKRAERLSGCPRGQALQRWKCFDGVPAGGADRLRNLRELLHELVVTCVAMSEVDAVDEAKDDCRKRAEGSDRERGREG